MLRRTGWFGPLGLALLVIAGAHADAASATIHGQVFEDVNYGGGAGRSLAASSGVGRAGARVERYTAAGAFVDATTTDAAGGYAFPVTTSGSFIVRVVNSTVRSARLGANGNDVGVQTYRTDASSGTPVPVTNLVGGEQPQKTDAPANSGTQTLASLQALNGMYTQSIASVATTLAGVGGVDFGFNFDTIVSTRNTGQGSLRQFIKNANLLTDDALLNQVGRTPGRETSIFMIPTTDPGYAASPLSFTISPLSALDAVTNPVILDATTQPDWTSAPIVQLLGTSAGTGSNGLTISAGNSTVRGFIIGKFGKNGIEVTSLGSNKVAGNYIGTTVSGTVASANVHDGIYVSGSKNNVVGGSTAADRNVVSGNTWVGIEIAGTGTTGNVIQGNYIGVDVTGNLALPNRNDGIDVAGGAGQTTIGGTAAGAGNVISGNNINTMDGIWINLGSGNTIQGNRIGTNAAGTAAIPNARSGIFILDSNNNTVGGTTGASGNVIAYNAKGVIVDGTSQGNAIRLNSIFSNTSLGIDLDGNGLTRNDNGDADIGPNDLRNFPVIQYAGIVGTNLVLAGWARKDSAIDFFVSAPDVNGFGEGKTPLTTLVEGSAADNDSSNGTYANPVNGLNQGTDTTNRFSFTIPLPTTVASGTKLTATATISGDTSEFAGNVTATLMPELGITKTDGLTFYRPGQTLTYTIVVTNTGSSAVVGATVSDVFPAKFSSVSWTCAATGGASCAPSGTGSINDTVAVPVNGILTYTVTAVVAASATGNIVNTAVVTPPAGVIDPTAGNNTATDTDPPPTADLSVTKTDGVATYTPGLPLTYTIVVGNVGPTEATGATVTDALPAGIASTTWTCVATAGASCTASGSGGISDSVSIPAGGTVTYAVTATVASSATANIKNTASVGVPPGVIDPVVGNNTASDTDTKGPSSSDLVITKSDGVGTYSPGGSLTYTIVATNLGPSDAINSRVSDLVTSLPQVAGASWTCAATGGATCPAGPTNGGINSARADLPVGGTASFTLDVTLSSSATGDLVNAASIVPPSGTNDPTPANNTASDTDTRGGLSSNLAITKTDGVASYSAGGTLTYTIKVTNLGPSDAAAAKVQDTFPAGITSATWSCSAATGASCTATGSGNIDDSVNVPVGGNVTYTVTATVASSMTGDLTNTATVSAPTGTTDPSLSNNSASDTDTLGTSKADLRITKTDGVATYTPGLPLTYTIIVSNTGPADVTGATVTDTFPAAITSATWSCVASAGASCAASGTGNINDTVNIPLGSSVTYTVTAVVASSQTGDFKNTASVSPPAGVGDPVSGNSSASDNDTKGTSVSDLVITKSDGVATYSPGGAVTYTIAATNLGPSDAINSRVSDLVTSLPQVAAASWTCAGTAGATCPGGTHNGSINSERADLPVGGTVTFTLVVTLKSSASGDLVNTASIVPPSGANDPTPANNSASDTDTLGSSSSDLAITKTDGFLSYSAGGNLTYTIKVTNTGPGDAVGAKVQDTFPAGITSASWTCSATTGAFCAASGSGNIDDSVNVPVGGNVTYTVTATVASSMTGDLTNTATVMAPTGTTDPTLSNNSASDTDTLGTSKADLRITKTDGVASYSPGLPLTYTIVVSNVGPADVTGATVTDTFPAAIASASWSCAPAAGASCTASGSGNISDSVSIPVGSNVTYTVTAVVASSQTGDFKNTASVSPPAGVGDPSSGNNTASDEDSRGTSVSDLVITKSDGVATYSPGGTVTYTIAATNLGPSDAINSRVSDLVTSLPQVAAASWTCVGTGGATCPAGPNNGSISSQRADLPVGGTVTFSLVVTLESSATGPLVNTASIVPPSGSSDPTPADNSASDTDTRGALSSDLAITKSDGFASYSAGGTLTYTIKVTNAGPSDAAGATVRDTFPAEITGASWTCSASAGGSCTAGGSGDIDDSVNVPVGATLTYTVDVTLVSSLTGDLTNTATVSAPVGTTDPVLANNSASDTDALGTSKADLRITKSDGVSRYLAGGTLTYTIVVSNLGPADATGATVTDTFPAAITSATWTCVAAAGASCTASGSGNINDSVNIPLGSSVTYTVTAVVASSQTADFKNTARVTPPVGVGDPVSSNNSASDEDSKGPSVSDLVITKSDGIATYSPGKTVTYTIAATNLGPSDAINAHLSDLVMSLPQVAAASWTCVGTGGAACPAGPQNGNINSERVDLPVGDTVTFTLVVTLDSSAAGTLVNTASIVPPSGASDPTPADNSASDTDTRGALSSDLAITKTDGFQSYSAGGTLTYTIKVTNSGPSDAIGAKVQDTFPAGVTGASWTCSATAGASCTASGSGNIDDSVNVPVGATLTYTVDVTVLSSLTADLTNTATVSAPVGTSDPVLANNSASDTDTLGTSKADLRITKTDGVPTYSPGLPLTYTIVVSNVGPADVTGATVTDTFPAAIASAAWSCVAAAGASCTASGSGNINDSVTISLGSSVTYTVTAVVASSQTGEFKNTARVSPPAGVGDPVSGNNTASDTDDPGTSVSDLALTKSDGVGIYLAGGTVTYTIVATNLGPSDAINARVSDLVMSLPQVAAASWTCVGTGGATCTAGPKNGNINTERVDVPVGGSVTFTLVVTLKSSATGTLINTASIVPRSGATDPTPANNSASDADLRGPLEADVRITKNDGVLSYFPGGTLTYTIVATNGGPSDALDARVSDPVLSLPQVTGASWTCIGAGGATCAAGPQSGSIVSEPVDLPVGGTATFTLVATLAASATGDLTNTATISAPANAIDAFPGNNGASDTDTEGVTAADLGITKNDGATAYTPGGTLTYTIVASNAGPVDVAGATVVDTFPAGIASASWSCAATAGASCTPTGSGSINDSVGLPAGTSVTYTVTALIASSASGPLVNTASVSAPAGIGDPVSGNNSASDHDNVAAAVVDLAFTKSDGVATYSPGETVTYTITATNLGPSDAIDARLTDLVMSLPQVAAASWTCVASGGATCTAGPVSGDIASERVDLPVGGGVTFTLVVTLKSSATGDLVNVATIVPPAGANDPVPGNDTATDVDTRGAPSSDLAITKSDGVPSYSPGGTLTYTIEVTNLGPGDAAAAKVQDTFPAGITSASWTCAASAGASCTATGTGTGNVDDTVNVPVGAVLTYTVVATLAPSLTGDLVNTATVVAAIGTTDPVAANDSAADTDTQGAAAADLAITKSDGVATYIPGGALTYTIVVSNLGPADVAAATVSDTFPPGIASASWSCAPSPGASCTSTGSGDINDTVGLPAGKSVTYTVTALVTSSATGTLKNTASVSPPSGIGDPISSNNSASDEDGEGSSAADLVVTTSDGVSDYTPGGTLTYTISATNLGPSDAIDARLTDLVMSLPQVAAASWTCVASGGGACTAGPQSGDISSERVDLPVGGTATFTLIATLASSATGDLVNTASIVPPVGTNDPVSANDTATDTDARGALSSDFAIVKDDGVSSYSAGGTLTYTIQVSNLGPSDAVGAKVVDTFPAGITSASWTCAPSAGASCTATGTGDLDDSVNVPVGANVAYTVVATLSPSLTGDLVNTATIAAANGATDPVAANDSASDTDTEGAAAADLSITKSDGVDAFTPGGTLTYTIVVSNAGPADVAAATVSDTFPAGIASATWSCVAAAGASCTASGSGDLNDTVSLPAGTSATYTVVALVASSASGSLKNTASVSPPAGIGDPVSENNSASDQDGEGPSITDLVITKDDGVGSYTPGGTLTYTITATNFGPSDAIDARLSDLVTSLPQVAAASWTCVATGGAACTAGPLSGDISSERVDLPVGGTATFTLVVTLASSATGDLANAATIAAPAGASDPVPGNNGATDTDTRGALVADLGVTKTDHVASYTPGGSLIYTIVVSNAGPSDVVGASVNDTLPAGLASAAWTCAPSAGAACTPSGVANINDTVNLPAGGSVTYTVTAPIGSSTSGDLVNTAEVVVPAGASDPAPGNNGATDTDTQGALVADLGVTKTDGVTSYTPGDTLAYTIVVSNAGPSDVIGALVDDPLPVSVASASWSCAPQGGASCTAVGSGSVSDVVNLPMGTSVTYTLTATVASSATGSLANTATVSLPTGVGDPAPSNNVATDVDAEGTAVLNLGITKTDGATSYVPGTTTTYTIVVSNAGPSDVSGATVKDALPSTMVGASWTCAPSAGASCAANGTGSLNETVDIPAGGSVIYTLTAPIAPSASGNLVNTATVAAPAGASDPKPGDDSATDTDTMGTLAADLGITKTDGVVTYAPGTNVTYTIEVTNAGPSDAVGATVSDVFPSAITSAAWTCVGSAGASCAGSGTGSINDAVSLPAAGTVTYTVVASIASSATVSLVNTATVTAPAGVSDPVPGDNLATDTDALGTLLTDLGITKTDGATGYVPGTTATYTIVATNAGPSDVTGAKVTDDFPAAIAGASWTCVPSAGASCASNGSGNLNDSVDIPVGGSVTYTVTAPIDSSAEGDLVNTAVVAAPAGASDPTPGNNAATDTDTRGTPVADLSVTKTDHVSSYTPGGPLIYTIVVSNAGPSDVVGASVNDTFPAAILIASWTCAHSPGASCTPLGVGNINDTVNIPAGGSVTYTVISTVTPFATGSLQNTVTVAAPTIVTDPNPGNNTATDTDTQGTSLADLGITKTDGVTSYTPGGALTYTIVVSNSGPSDVTGALVDDTLPASVASASWTCVPQAGATCTATGGGDLSDVVNLPADTSVTYTVTVAVASSATGTLANTATVSLPSGVGDPTPSNNTATDTDSQDAAVCNLGITKTDGATSYVPGTTTTYTIVVTNAGPSDAVGATIGDSLPAAFTSAAWSCAPSAGAACSGSGSGSISDTVDVPVGGSVAYTVVASIAPSAAGNLTNTATVAAPPNASDPAPGDNSATDTDSLGTLTADLGITKTDGVVRYTPGTTVTYTIVVTNAGPSNVTAATVSDVFPPAIASASWTCAAAAGASCAASGTGSINQTVDIPAGGSVTFTVVASIDSSAAGDLVNTATVAAPAGVTDPVPGNDLATDTDAQGQRVGDLAVTKTDGVSSYTPGATTTYTIVVSNAGPSAVHGAVVGDTLPAGIASASWTCAPQPGATCTATGNGDLTDVVNLPAGKSVTYTVVASIAGSATGDLVNTATVAAPSGTSEPQPGDNTATDSDTQGAKVADLGVTKTDGVTEYTPGTTTTYTIVVTNAGPSDVSGATVTDALPAGITGASWTCVPSAGASCTASGTGDINDMVHVPAGGSVTYVVTASIAASATGDVANTVTVVAPAGVTDPVAANDSATDTDAQGTAIVDLGITNTDGVPNYTPGENRTYTIVVTNAGPSDAIGATVTDVFPSAITSNSWTCVASAGASCAASGTGNINQTVNVPVGGSVTYTAVATIASSATGNLVNTATVAVPPNTTDPVPADNSASDTDTVSASADLSLTNSVDNASPRVGDSVVYTLSVANAGPSDATGVVVSDPLPSGVSWTSDDASTTGATYDTATGAWTVGLVPAGAAKSLHLTATILAAGSWINAAQVAASGAADPDSSPGNGTGNAEDDEASVAVAPTAAIDLSLAKTVDAPVPAVGSLVVFTLTVANAGGLSDATVVVVADALPAGFAHVSDDATLSSTSYDPASGAWSVGGLASGSNKVLHITARVRPTGPWVNLAEVAAAGEGDLDSTPGNGTGRGEDDESSVAAVPPGNDGTIDVTDLLIPGQAVTVTVHDPDLDLDPAVAESTSITLVDRATGEWETLSLNETGPATAVFTATAATVFGVAAGANDDGVLVVQAGQQVAASYLDERTAAGGSATRTDAGQIAGGVDGSVALPGTVSAGSPLRVTVTDRDLDANPSAADTVTVTVGNDATGESETVVLTETGSATGIFAGTVGTVFGSAAGPAGDGVIVTLPGETISARYLDAFTAAGGTAVRSAAARAVADVIRLDKRATKDEVILGELVGFVVTATNTAPVAMPGVLLEDSLPPGFKIVEGSARLSRAGTDGTLGTQDDATTVLASTGGRPIVLGPVDFAAGEVVAVTYLLRSGAGAVPGVRTNLVIPSQAGVPVGNSAEAAVTLVADPVLDGCRILGKVFQDTNRNGVQDADEPGVAAATVVLDEGTYAVTDAFGRYHLPAVSPGQRLVKLDVGSLSAGSETIGDDSRILWLTPGLTGHADFPVITILRETTIGRPAEPGLLIEGAAEHDPIAIQGKAEQLSVLVNDRLVDLAWSAVRIQTTTLDDIVVLTGDHLKEPVSFQLSLDTTREAKTWSLAIDDAAGATIKTVTGDGLPPESVKWGGTSDAGEMLRAGEIYQYQLEVAYRDGSVARSPRRLLGVNRDKVVSVELRGEAFASNQTVLSVKAKETLKKLVELLRAYPGEKILIEGYTDAVGSAEHNLELSRKRAEAARDYLGTLGFPVGRTVLHGYGRERPIAPNDSEAGRQLNRRVEVKSQVVEVQSTEITERYRTEPSVRVNGESVPLGPMGRFATQLDSASVPRVDLEVADSQGRLAKTRVELPRLELEVPNEEVVSRTTLPNPGAFCRMPDSAAAPGAAVALECVVRGRTDPGNVVSVDGHPVAVGADGSFVITETLATGENAIGVLARNPQGYSHAANLVLKVSDRDAGGNVVVATKPVPRLTLTLPPDGTRIDSGVLSIAGATDPGNSVVANGTEMTVGRDGAVSGSLTLPAGRSTVTVRVTDPEGNAGEIVSTFEVPQTRLFLLAFADGEFGQLNGKGYIEGAGLDTASSTYTDGRVAVYLKGRISGKYLITAAYDSGREDGNGLFGELDRNGQQKLLTNLDPNLYYTVYGDESTTVYDVESQGRFYLAVDGETIHAVVGNYPIAFSGTELATYQRTLYGARFLYRSAQTNSRSEPETEVVVFGAEVRQGHIRDELRATGGSLYYLSHKDLVEGGEHVSLVVRDKNTGLELSRVAQRQNFDYTIRYPEGRIVFNRPVWSVQDGGSLADGQILQGNPVSIQVDYEAVLQDFEKTAAGARVVQQLGDHVAIGGTYVRDELQGGPYELAGVDAVAHLADGTLLAAELAASSGTDALTFVSNDGGLTYATSAPTGTEKGSAARASAEFDVGRWFKTPDRYKVKLYYKELEPGFSSNGTFLDQGTTTVGASAQLQVTAKDSIGVLLDHQELTRSTTLLPGGSGTTDIESVQWNHKETRWGVTAEYFNRGVSDETASSQKSTSYLVARAWMQMTEKVKGWLEHQQTISGPANDQTNAGVSYQVRKNIALDAQATYGSLGSSAQAGAAIDLKGTSVYLNERLTDGPAGQNTTTVLGARSPLGRSSSVYTEYQWESATTGDRAVSLVGLQRQWEPVVGWKFVFSGESARVSAKTQNTNRSVVAAGVTYTGASSISLVSRSELRLDSGEARLRQILTSNQFDYKLREDLTFQARFRFSTTENRDSDVTEAKFEERGIGLAWRPVASNRWNALARYSHVLNQNPVPTGAPASPTRSMDVFSVESIFAVTPRVEWLAKAAVQFQKEAIAGFEAPDSKAYLTIQRFNFNLWKALDLGAEYRILAESATRSQRQGALTELSWGLIKMLRLGVGYNFTDFSDNELSQNDYSVHGWFFRVQGRY